MTELMLILMPIVFVGLMIAIGTRHMPATCPECQNPLSRFQSPYTKTRRQWLYGGYQCSNCSSELDQQGVVVGMADDSKRLSGSFVTAIIVVPMVVALLLRLARLCC